MKINRVLIISLIFCLLIGCGQTTSVEPNSSDDADTNIETPIDDISNDIEVEDVEYPTDWGQAYIDYLNTIDYGLDDSNREEILSGWDFSLIYLDDNDIPELWIDSNVEAGGEIVVTYYEGKTIDYHLSRIGTEYIPRTGMLYTDTGHMDYYPVYISKLAGGEFTQLAEGLYYMSDEERERVSQEDLKWEDIQYTYEWEGTGITEEVFNDKIASYIDKDLLERPEKTYQLSEIRSILQTGKWSSYGHRYELVKENTSWQEAFDKAQSNGGYLAIITCNEEIDEVKSLIENEKMTDISFYIAYRDCEWVGEEFMNERWVLPSGETVDSYILYQYSYLYDPDYDFSNFKEKEWDDLNDGNAGLLMYKPTGLYLYNAPDDISNSVPKYRNHVGYIIEYDE